MNFSKLNWLLELKRQVDIAVSLVNTGVVRENISPMANYKPPEGCNARIGDFGILVPERFTREGVQQFGEEPKEPLGPSDVDPNGGDWSSGPSCQFTGDSSPEIPPDPVCRYEPDTSKELWWCNSHERRATHIARHPGFCIDGTHQCDPKLPGIMLPCQCVNLTGIAEIEEGETEPHFPAVKAKDCQKCKGRGVIEWLDGATWYQQRCPICHGTGKLKDSQPRREPIDDPAQGVRQSALTGPH